MLQGFSDDDKKGENDRPEKSETENPFSGNASRFFDFYRVIDDFRFFFFVFLLDDLDIDCFYLLFFSIGCRIR